jgi:ArsR family transcriptional regulator
MQGLTQLLAALADPTRLRLVRLLLHQEELCVCELVDALGMPQYKVSRHLRRLRAIGLVEARRQGRWMHYRIGRQLRPGGGHRELLVALEGDLTRLPEARRDEVRLGKRLALRRSGECVVGKSGC